MGSLAIVPDPLLGHVYALTQEVLFLEQKCQFGTYFQSNTPVVANNVVPDENVIAGHWIGIIVPKLLPCLSVGTALGFVKIWCMTWPNVATNISTVPGGVGSYAGEPMPPQIAGVLSKRTLLRGKSGRGRMYLCGMSEDANTAGKPDPVVVNAINAFGVQLAAPWVDPGTTFTYSPVVVSLKAYAHDRLTNPPPEGNPPFIPKVPPLTVRGSLLAGAICDPIWYTQRRRTIGRGQ